MINKHDLLLFAVLFSIFPPGLAIAKQPSSIPVENGARQAGETNRQYKEKMGRWNEQDQEQKKAKQERFENMRRRYLDDAALPERRVYRRSKDNAERPMSRYEDFEQKRERHRKYNEYIEQNNLDKPADRRQLGTEEIDSD
ncbi:hypothetical protein [Methylotuvimicrobium buryatense]|uniref:DUF3106 domain-containing protein n=1 Tax=Methylotuvimicrobium buryatense TaxID=95641 RepID=A0A4P9UN43_METBY|nr:hypothetical protein [Methylotuvimicrobium buryatense]QCW81621.1 hypothetical protein EQU24_04690 [Methylotuvimicrobium buryatense]